MRIVCGTNVLLSAYLFRSGKSVTPTLATACTALPPTGAVPCLGRPSAAATWLRQAVDEQHLSLVFDRHTTAELLRVLAYERFALTKSERERVLFRVMLHAQAHLKPKLAATARSIPPCRDPQDQMFIDLAYAAGVDALVSGDKDLISLASHSAVPILKPQQLRERMGL